MSHLNWPSPLPPNVLATGCILMSQAHAVLSVNDDLPIRTDSPVHSGKVRSVYWLTKADSARLIAERGYDVDANAELQLLLDAVCQQAITGMESTKELLATKGRASFLGERAIGHIDAGARTSQLMICAIADTLSN